jgi:putative Mn2+ efflux pump MntP
MADLGPVNLLAVAVGLGMDAMSVAMGVGVRWHGPRQRFRLSFHMGLFQFLMPLLGWLAGRELAGLLADWGKWIAGALVLAIGIKMLYEALRSHPGATAEAVEHEAEEVLHVPADPTRGWSLLVLSVATSIDALVVGLSLGLKQVSIWGASVVIGIVAALMALTGIAIGKRLGQQFGRPAEIFGALVLIALAVSFVVL